MIKYLGSKRVLIPKLMGIFEALSAGPRFLDLFSGTSRVSCAMKERGFRTFANDHNAYASTIARCYITGDRGRYFDTASALVQELNQIKGSPGYFTETFCIKSRFFKPENGERVDAIREEIARKSLPIILESILLTSLMEAADRVDSTTAVQMAYLKNWAKRSHNPLELRVPSLIPRASSGTGAALEMEALEAARSIEADLCYLDPPYNQHSYLGNYHIWESLVRWDKPEVYGVACKRVDVRTRKSDYNSKRKALSAFTELIRAVQAKALVVSFNDEGFLSRTDLEALLVERGKVFVFAEDFKRYVGAQIGIHNPDGEKTGTVSHLRNTEYIYVVTEDDVALSRLRDL